MPPALAQMAESVTRTLGGMTERMSQLLVAEDADEAMPVGDGVAALAAYLEERMCVPRDMGAAAAAAVRRLHRRVNGEPTEAVGRVSVNRF